MFKPNNNINHITENLELKEGIWYSKSFSAISYPETANNECYRIEENSFWFKHRNNCIVEIANHFIKDEKVLIDIGGGNGFVSLGLEKSGIECFLVEPGIQGILNARKRGLQNLFCSTLEDASFIDASLPNIGLFDVVGHIKEDGEFLKSIHQFLKPGGRVFITVPAYKFLWSSEDYYAGHFRRYTLNSLGKKLNGAGFIIEYKTYFFRFLPPIIFLFRTIPSKIGLKGKNNEIKIKEGEHKIKAGPISKILNRVSKREVNKLNKGKRMRFGGSCLVVAQKS